MVGGMPALFASSNGTDSENRAVFHWAEYEDL